MSSESDTRTTSTSATTQSGTPVSNGSYSGSFTASESYSRKKIKGWRLPTDQKNWSDSIHQQCKPKFPKFKAGKHPYLKPGLKYWGHSARDAWSRGIVDYDPCDTLECGCAPKYEDDGPCVVNNNCPNCPKIPHRPVHKKRNCSQDFRPPRPVISKPFTPVVTVKSVKSNPSRPLPKPVPSRPLPKPVVSRPLLVPVTSKPSSPWPAATVKLVKSNPSRPITRPSPSRPIPKPVISRPKSVPSRPLPKPVVSKPSPKPVVSKPPPKPVVSRPPPKPVVSRPKPVISRPKPIISTSKPLPKSQPSRPKPSNSPTPKRKSPPPKLKSFPPIEPKPKSILRSPSSTSPSNKSSTSSKKHTKKSQKSSSSKDSSSPNYSSSSKYTSSSGPSYTDSSSYNTSFVEYHYYEYSSDTDDSKPQKKKTESKKPLKQSPSDALRMAILLRRQNAQRAQASLQIPDPDQPVLTNPDEGVSVLYTSPGVVPRHFDQRGSDDEGHALFGGDNETVPPGRSMSIPAPSQDPNVPPEDSSGAPRLMGSTEFRTNNPFTEDATMTTDLQIPPSQRVTFENDQEEKQLDYSNDFRN